MCQGAKETILFMMSNEYVNYLVMTSNVSMNYQYGLIMDVDYSNHTTQDKNMVKSMTNYKGDKDIKIANDSKMLSTHNSNTLVAPYFNLR